MTHARHSSTNRDHARRADASMPEPVPDGYARCDCGRVLKILKSGRLKMHKTPRGYECSGTVGHGKPTAWIVEHAEELAAKFEAHEPGSKPMYVAGSRADEAYHATRGECRICEKPLPGERTLCGACGVKEGR